MFKNIEMYMQRIKGRMDCEVGWGEQKKKAYHPSMIGEQQ